MTSLFTLLAARYPSAAQCAAALGMTRQAYSQAAQRGQLSPLYTIRAAGLLDLDPAQTILDHIAAALPDAERAALSTARANNVTTPINNPAPPCPDNPRQPPVDTAVSLPKDYVKQKIIFMQPGVFRKYFRFFAKKLRIAPSPLRCGSLRTDDSRVGAVQD